MVTIQNPMKNNMNLSGNTDFLREMVPKGCRGAGLRWRPLRSSSARRKCPWGAPTDAAAEKAAAETDRKMPGGEAVGNALGVPPAISTRDKNRALFLSVYTTPESCFFKMRRGTE